MSRTISVNRRFDAIIHHKGSVFLYGDEDSEAIVEYNTATMKQVMSFKHPNYGYCSNVEVADLYVFGCFDNVVLQWDREGNILNEVVIPLFESDDSQVYSIKFVDNVLYVCGENKAIVRYDMNQTPPVLDTIVYKSTEEIASFVVFEDKVVGTSGPFFNVWNKQTGELESKEKLDATVPFIANSNDSKVFITQRGPPLKAWVYDHVEKRVDYKGTFSGTGSSSEMDVCGDHIYFSVDNTIEVGLIDSSVSVPKQVYAEVDEEDEITDFCVVPLQVPPNEQETNVDIFIIIDIYLMRVRVNFSNDWSNVFPEEDYQDFTAAETDSDSLSQSDSDYTSNCTNDNLITLEPYTLEDGPIAVFVPNSVGKYQKAICATRDELVQYLEAFRDTAIPDNIMTVYSSPRDADISGYGGKPTGKVFVKLPANNLYITMGSMKKILSRTRTDKTWFAVPLFGGKRRRLGNLLGIFGASMNHGQVPGFVVYKLYTRSQIALGVVAMEDDNDYPVFLVESARTLYDIVGENATINAAFVSGLIDTMIG
jgi:hypothetical protein